MLEAVYAGGQILPWNAGRVPSRRAEAAWLHPGATGIAMRPGEASGLPSIPNLGVAVGRVVV